MSARTVSIDDAVLEAFPSARVSGLVATGLSIGDGADAPEAPVSDAVEPEVAAWKEAYRRMGVKPSAVRSSLDALSRMVAKGRSPFGINAAVDAYNAVSLEHALCMGAYDVDTLGSSVEVRFGRPGEELVPIGGGTPIGVDERAVVYADERRVLCAYWNHRDADATKLGGQTTSAVFFVDELVAQPGRAERALADLGDRVTATCGGAVVQTFHLDRGRTRAELSA
jgi:DNA/RNA-binding domain of Phe-tRNA-synthetase-like protein